MKLFKFYALASTYTLLFTFDFDTPALFSGYLLCRAVKREAPYRKTETVLRAPRIRTTAFSLEMGIGERLL